MALSFQYVYVCAKRAQKVQIQEKEISVSDRNYQGGARPKAETGICEKDKKKPSSEGRRPSKTGEIPAKLFFQPLRK